MNVFNKRFYACIALIFLVFTEISFENKNLIFFPIFAIFLVVFYLIMSKRRQKSSNLKLVCLLLLCSAILGILSSRLHIFKNDLMVDKYSGEHTVSGYVVEVSSHQSFIGEYVVRVEKIDDKKVNFDMVLVSNYQSYLSRGDFFELKGDLSSLSDYKDYDYLKNKNEHDYPIICVIDEKDEIANKESEFRISLMLSGLNAKLSSTLKALLGKDAGSFASALLLGNRELLSDNALRDFKRAGIYHMLALSGMHVAILIGIFDWLLKKLFIPRGIRLGVLAFLSLFYVALTGFALSACRSMLMLGLLYLSLTLGRRRDALTSLFFAVSVIVLITPSAILDIGLQLSFLSTFGVISGAIICDKLKWLKKDINEGGIKARAFGLLSKLLTVIIASLCVFIVTLPILMLYFGEVSLATFISNIFMGVICEIFMILSLLTLVFSWSIYLRFPFAELSVRTGNFMTKIVSFISDIDNVMLSLEYPFVEILVWGLFIAFVLMLSIRLSRKWLIFVPSVLFAILLCVNITIYDIQREKFVRAEYLSGDTLVLSSSNRVYICDASDGTYGNLYESVATAKENCFTEIDGIILTHYHSKHVVSLERLAKSYKIHSVLLPKPQNSDEDLIMRSIVRVLSKENVEVYVFDNERDLEILSGKLSISSRSYIAGYAHPSIAISFAYGNERITLIEKPYFDTYIEESGAFDEHIANSNYLIFGADGRNPQQNFEIFSNLKKECEVSFADFEFMNKSDFEDYLDTYRIYFGVEYKKYDLK